MGDTYNPTANFRLVVAHRALASPCAVASCPTSRFSRRRSSRQASFCDSSRRTTDADPHLVVSEIDPFAKTERGRIAKPYHLSIATDQFRSEVVRRKREQFAHERLHCELLGLTRMRDPGLFDQGRVATDLPRNEPMHDQLRSVAYNSLIDFDCHGKSNIAAPCSQEGCHLRVCPADERYNFDEP